VQDDPQPPVQDDPQPPVQVDSTNPDDNKQEEVPALPDAGVWANNTQILRLYYEFLAGKETALNISPYEISTVNGSIAWDGKNPVSAFAFADFGSDGILEVVMADSMDHYYTVLFYENGRLFTEGIGIRSMGGLKYNGIASGSGGTSGYWNLLTVSSDVGIRRQCIAAYQFDDEIRETAYFILASFEDGKYTETPTKRVSKDEYDIFAETRHFSPKVAWYDYSKEELDRVFADILANTASTSPAQAPCLTIPSEEAEAFEAYYSFIMGDSSAYDTHNRREITFSQLTKNGEASFVNFQPVDIGLDGRREVVLNRTGENPDALLFYENGRLYLGYFPEGQRYNINYDASYHLADVKAPDGMYGSMQVMLTCSAEEGVSAQPIKSSLYGTVNGKWTYYYYAHVAYENGRYLPIEKTEIPKSEYWVLTDSMFEETIAPSYDLTGSNLMLYFLGITPPQK